MKHLYEDAIIDVLLERFPWLIELLEVPDQPIEDLIKFLAGMAFSYGYRAGKNESLIETKKKLYDPITNEEKKSYDN